MMQVCTGQNLLLFSCIQSEQIWEYMSTLSDTIESRLKADSFMIHNKHSAHIKMKQKEEENFEQYEGNL